ncbi:MAG: sugar phosphate isomerase/epimerase family protein [Acidobacteriota bacterium]
MISRRAMLAAPAAAMAAAPTRFTLAGMTLAWSAFSFARALEGIRAAGFAEVAWGVNHESGPLLRPEEPAGRAAELARECRDAGLKPVMMFSTVNLEAEGAGAGHRRRLAQAEAAGIRFLLTFGKTAGGQRERFVANLKELGPEAADRGVVVVIKQHGGNTGTGQLCARILEEVGHPAVRLCYDAVNVLDYENADPIADIATCAGYIEAFNIKDHRNSPKDEDCGPGFGEIDHYKLLSAVLHTGRTIPLTFENIFAPLVARPREAAEVDRLAARARDYIDTVIRGLQT